jgi:ketosteroid isomerase-like protein
MRYFITAIILLTTIASQAQSADAQSDIAALKALNAAFINGYMTKDTTKLSPIFANDFILINPSGQRRNRQEVLDGFVSSPHFLSCKVDTVEIRLYGTIGLVLARAVFTSEDKGKKTTGKTDYLDVYEKRNGRWVAIAAHVTYLGGK